MVSKLFIVLCTQQRLSCLSRLGFYGALLLVTICVIGKSSSLKGPLHPQSSYQLATRKFLPAANKPLLAALLVLAILSFIHLGINASDVRTMFVNAETADDTILVIYELLVARSHNLIMYCIVSPMPLLTDYILVSAALRGQDQS
jgi:hypothetical protein